MSENVCVLTRCECCEVLEIEQGLGHDINEHPTPEHYRFPCPECNALMIIGGPSIAFEEVTRPTLQHWIRLALDPDNPYLDRHLR